MSKFATKIPVNTDAVKHLLPKGAYVHEATYDKASNAVVVTWEHGQLHTGFGFPVEFSQEMLVEKVIPTGVTDLRPPPKIASKEIPVETVGEEGPQEVPLEPAGGKRRGRSPKTE